MAVLLINHIAHAIYLVLQGKDAQEQAKTLPKVVQFLVKKRMLPKTPEILSQLEKLINEKENVVKVRVSSARELSEKTKRELNQILTRRYAGKTISLVSEIDEQLVGGFRIEAEDEVIDLSIRNQILKLQEHLTRSI